MNYQELPWDTNYFNINIVKYYSKIMGSEQLSYIHYCLKNNGIRLAYIELENKLVDMHKNINIKLVDKKTTFRINLSKKLFDEYTPSAFVEPFKDSMSIVKLENLAIQSGKYSRFSVDEKISKEQFEGLYKLWIRKSLNSKISNNVFVIKEKNNIAGMIALGENNGGGKIELIAVDSPFRGKKYSVDLVRSANRWFLLNEYKTSQVITQGANIAACKLYTKCGYKIEKVTYYYHLWL